MTKCSITITEGLFMPKGKNGSYASTTLGSTEKVRDLYNDKELAHAFIYRLLEAFIRQIDESNKEGDNDVHSN